LYSISMTFELNFIVHILLHHDENIRHMVEVGSPAQVLSR
jgi:hypothetical protein